MLRHHLYMFSNGFFSPQNPPFILNSKDNSGTDLNGYLYDLWLSLQNDLNFTTEIVPSADGLWGSRNEDGKWSGFFGMLLDNKIDLSMADTTLTKHRADYFAHTIAFHRDR